MKIRIVYGTNSSGTKEASELMRDVFVQAGNSVTLTSAAMAKAEDLIGADLVILGSCTWERITPTARLDGQLQQHFFKFQTKLQGKHTPGQRFAVFGLGDSTYTRFCAAADHLEALVSSLGGTKVGSTLRLDKFFFRLDENRRRITEWIHELRRELAKQNV